MAKSSSDKRLVPPRDETGPKTDLEWVKKKLRAFVDRHEGEEDKASLVLDSLKTLGGLLVKSEPKRSQDGAPPGFLDHNPVDSKNQPE